MAHELPEEKMFDKRLVDRYIRQGLVTQEQYEAWLAAQPDLSPDADVVSVDGVGVGVGGGGGSPGSWKPSGD